MRIFLGGTCNGSTWRDELIPNLRMDYFNPIVDEWTEEAYRRELIEREMCDICLYVITPKATGFYSIAEAADDSNKRPDKTVLCVILEDGGLRFNHHQMKSLVKTGKLITENGGYFCEGMEELVAYLASRQKLTMPLR